VSSEERAARDAAYRATHKEERAAASCAYHAAHKEERAAYRAVHREERAARQAAYRAAHKEGRAARDAAYYAAHREKAAAYNNAYKAAHLDVGRAHEAKRRALKKGATVGAITTEALAEKRAEYSGICPYCNQPITEGHFDHVVPLSKGGSHTTDNLVWVCAECNLKKGDKSLLGYLLATAT